MVHAGQHKCRGLHGRRLVRKKWSAANHLDCERCIASFGSRSCRYPHAFDCVYIHTCRHVFVHAVASLGRYPPLAAAGSYMQDLARVAGGAVWYGSTRPADDVVV